jgi:hypothetical protein
VLGKQRVQEAQYPYSLVFRRHKAAEALIAHSSIRIADCPGISLFAGTAAGSAPFTQPYSMVDVLLKIDSGMLGVFAVGKPIALFLAR